MDIAGGRIISRAIFVGAFMRKFIFVLAGIAALLFCAPSYGDVTNYDPKPWLEDLAQTREVLLTKYANLEWAVFDREAKLPALFADTQKRIENAKSEADARAAFDRLAKRLGDGHVEFQWKQVGAQEDGNNPASPPCADYTSDIVNPPLVALAPGYRAIKTPQSDVFPIGIIESGKHRIGVLRLALFEPQGFPQLCQSAIASLSVPADKPCDDVCQKRIADFANRRFTEDFIAQIKALKDAGADTLLVDVTHNGGGSEWAEAAMRMLTDRPLTSERLRFMRGEHWVKELGDFEKDMRDAAAKAVDADERFFLLKLAEEAKAKKEVAGTPCDASALWVGVHPSCPFLGDGFYGSGMVSTSLPARFAKKEWAGDVFSANEYPFEAGVWHGPLMVLVDRETWSAAEEFAAVLQDNHAATIIGEPTGGAGCGHTDGGTPTTLKNSRAVLEVPDCVRIRADGSNEVRGIRPDVLTGWRNTDGPTRRAADFAALLPEIVDARN